MKNLIIAATIITITFCHLSAAYAEQEAGETEEFTFEFTQWTEEKDAIFIETKEKRKLPSDFDISKEPYELHYYIPLSQEYVKVNELPKLPEEYTLITSNGIQTLIPTSYYYLYDRLANNHKILIKLVLKEPLPSDLGNEPFIIIRKPHPDIKKLNVARYKETEVPESLKYRLDPAFQEKFDKLMEQDESIQFIGGSWGTARHYFSDNKLSMVYFTSEESSAQYISARWLSDNGWKGCCLSTLYKVKKTDDEVILEEAIPLSNGAQKIFEVKKIVNINNRDYAFISESGWEWDHDSIYIIGPDSKWKSYKSAIGHYH
jgi:hypothetical protein